MLHAFCCMLHDAGHSRLLYTRYVSSALLVTDLLTDGTEYVPGAAEVRKLRAKTRMQNHGGFGASGAVGTSTPPVRSAPQMPLADARAASPNLVKTNKIVPLPPSQINASGANQRAVVAEEPSVPCVPIIDMRMLQLSMFFPDPHPANLVWLTRLTHVRNT